VSHRYSLTMISDPPDVSTAVEDLLAHIELHGRERQLAKDSGRTWKATPQVKSERDVLMRAVLEKLALTREELCDTLGIKRPTWDRWRTLKTSPEPPQLDRLRKLGQAGGAQARPFSATVSQVRPTPWITLEGGPTASTWGRLRLVYSLFQWDNAIFYYPEPFADAATVTDMALLALRDLDSHGAKIVYILSEIDSWRHSYVECLKRVFGEQDAARVLSGICAIHVPITEMEKYSKGLGLFNYGHPNPELTVGYQWMYVAKPGDPERPPDDEAAVYWAFGPKDEAIRFIRNKFGELIKKAFKTIDDRRMLLPSFWEPQIPEDSIQELLKLPVVDWAQEQWAAK